MALKPTICKLTIDLSDIDRHVYDTLNLTVAQHPSETMERMMSRILCFCINSQEYLEFTKGLSAVDEPDIWAKSLDGQTSLWIDIGEPNPERIKKATRVASNVRVYSFNSKSEVWWNQNKDLLKKLKVSVYQFPWESIQALSELYERTMAFSVTISDDSCYISSERGECEVSWITLQTV